MWASPPGEPQVSSPGLVHPHNPSAGTFSLPRTFGCCSLRASTVPGTWRLCGSGILVLRGFTEALCTVLCRGTQGRAARPRAGQWQALWHMRTGSRVGAGAPAHEYTAEGAGEQRSVVAGAGEEGLPCGGPRVDRQGVQALLGNGVPSSAQVWLSTAMGYQCPWCSASHHSCFSCAGRAGMSQAGAVCLPGRPCQLAWHSRATETSAARRPQAPSISGLWRMLSSFHTQQVEQSQEGT